MQQPGAWTSQINEVHFLCDNSMSRLGEMAVLSNVQKLIQKVKEDKEIGTYILKNNNKI